MVLLDDFVTKYELDREHFIQFVMMTKQKHSYTPRGTAFDERNLAEIVANYDQYCKEKECEQMFSARLKKHFNEEKKQRKSENTSVPAYTRKETVNHIVDDSGNGIATTIAAIGIITIIGGLIMGVVTAMGRREFSFGLLLTYSAAGFASGMMLIGFSEIINLLDQQSETLLRIERKLNK